MLALNAFAFESGISLHSTIKSFKTYSKRGRDLTDKLDALSKVLGPLTETICATNDAALTALGLPLEQCGKACEEFGHKLVEWLSRVGGSRTSFRGWAKLVYVGYDTNGFRRLLGACRTGA
jgi:hypothetical protein